MNIKSHVLATLSIENIFTPASENFNTVYVTLSSITEANIIYSYSRRVRSRGSRNMSDEGLAAQDNQDQVQDKGTDKGRVIAEESYCPASPAPVKKTQVFSATVVDSPIFKKSQSSPFRMNPLVL